MFFAEQKGNTLRKVIVSAQIPLDGAVDAPHDDFLDYIDDELGAYHNDLLFDADALIMGRVTYELFVDYWPEHGGDPFGDRMNSIPKHVASRSLQEPLTWNATLLKDVAADVFALKQQPGQYILQYGMGELSYFLLQRGLVDEIRLQVYPLVVGKGRRIFEGFDKMPMKLLDSRRFNNGVLTLSYQPQSHS